MIFAIDFDGTICDSHYPNTGAGYSDRIETLLRLKKRGHKLILWTCRSGEALHTAIIWCKALGLEFDAVNEDVDIIKQSEFGNNKSVKIYADFYIDDRNISWDFARTISESVTINKGLE